MPSNSPLQTYYEKVQYTVLIANMTTLMNIIGVEFKVERPVSDTVYDTAYGSVGRDNEYERINPDGKGVINMSDFEFIPYSFDEIGRFERGWLFTFYNLEIADRITINRLNNFEVEQYIVMDKESFGTSSKVVYRYAIRPN